MSEEIKIDDEILTFKFSVAVTNAILNLLGQAPFVASAGLIQEVQKQAGPQVSEILSKQIQAGTTCAPTA